MLDFVIYMALNAGYYLEDNIHTDFSVELKCRINPVTSIDKEAQSIILGSIEKRFPNFSYKNYVVLRMFSRILGAAQGIRRLGSAALDLCYVARGSFDGYWEIGLNPWDIAAGSLMFQEAGGVVTNFDGKALDILYGDVIARKANIYSKLVGLV